MTKDLTGLLAIVSVVLLLAVIGHTPVHAESPQFDQYVRAHGGFGLGGLALGGAYGKKLDVLTETKGSLYAEGTAGLGVGIATIFGAGGYGVYQHPIENGKYFLRGKLGLLYISGDIAGFGFSGIGPSAAIGGGVRLDERSSVQVSIGNEGFLFGYNMKI